MCVENSPPPDNLYRVSVLLSRLNMYCKIKFINGGPPLFEERYNKTTLKKFKHHTNKRHKHKSGKKICNLDFGDTNKVKS